MAEKSKSKKNNNKNKNKPDELQLKCLSREKEGANPTSETSESSPSQLLSSSPGACVSQPDQYSSETASVEESQPDFQEETDGGLQASSTTKSKKGKKSEQKAEKKQGKAERKAKEKLERERKDREKYEQKEREKREKELAKQSEKKDPDKQRSKSFSFIGRKKNSHEKKSHVTPHSAERRHSDGQSPFENIPCDDLSDENMKRQPHDLQNVSFLLDTSLICHNIIIPWRSHFYCFRNLPTPYYVQVVKV